MNRWETKARCDVFASILADTLIGPTLYSDSTVANGTTYYYATTAVDVKGKESSKTPPVKAVIP